MLTRQVHPTDRRCMILALTPRGRATLQTAHDCAKACLAERLATLSDPERAVVVRAMQALRPLFTFERETATQAARKHNGYS